MYCIGTAEKLQNVAENWQNSLICLANVIVISTRTSSLMLIWGINGCLFTHRSFSWKLQCFRLLYNEACRTRSQITPVLEWLPIHWCPSFRPGYFSNLRKRCWLCWLHSEEMKNDNMFGMYCILLQLFIWPLFINSWNSGCLEQVLTLTSLITFAPSTKQISGGTCHCVIFPFFTKVWPLN